MFKLMSTFATYSGKNHFYGTSNIAFSFNLHWYTYEMGLATTSRFN